MIEAPLLIGDQDPVASGGATFDRRNPVSGEVASRSAAATAEDATAAADAAAAAFLAWSELGPSARRAKLLAAADLLEGRAGSSSS